MQDLIKQLTEKYNITEETATGIIDTVKTYLTTHASTGNILDKAKDFVEDHIPDGFKEKAGELKEKAEDMLEDAGEKLKGFFKK